MTGEEYLQQHAISQQFAQEQDLTWDEEELHIPVRDENGEVLFAKHRSLKHEPHNPDSKPKYRYDSGTHATLFNYHAVKAKAYIVVSEGEIDCLKLTQEGIPSVSSTGGANTFLPEWADLIKGKQIFICLDNDKAGQEGTKKITDLLPEAKVVTLPSGIKDICDYFAAGNVREDFIGLLKAGLTVADWKEKSRPEEFKLVCAKDLITREFPDDQWLIDKILYMEGFCFIYGAEGVGKSFITMSMAQALATGEKWLGQFNVPRKGKVLFIDKENPLPILAKRLAGMGIDSENMFWLERPELLTLTDDHGQMTEFAKVLCDVANDKQIDLIIVDSFVDLMVGSENSAEETQKFFDAMRVIFPHKAILVLHHENKPIQGAFRTESQRTRGSTNINAQAVTQFHIETVAKSKVDLTIKQTKIRNGQRLDKFMVRMKIAVEGEETTVVGFEYLGATTGNEDETKKTEVAKEMIVSILSEASAVSRQQIVETCQASGISEKTTQRVLKIMVDNGEAEESKVARTKYYSLLSEMVEAPPEYWYGI
jgi:archaellum biogenesis ATPase FlaH/vacuolar-type H+-ATPase subunit F/Vma7